MAAKECSVCGRKEYSQDLLIVGNFALWLCHECGEKMLWAASEFRKSAQQKKEKKEKPEVKE